jgi:sulfoxide reductase catalytic subunit YedY
VDIERPPPEDARPYGRRTFLTLVAGGVSSLLWGPAAWNIARDVLLPVAGVLPPPLAGLVRSGWRIYSVTSIPRFDPTTWSLKIDGLVERPVELSYADLQALPRAEQVTDFHCVTGWSVSDVRWGGVRFSDLLATARPLPAAQALGFFSGDGAYSDSLTMDQAHLPDAMLAYEMDGTPLTRPHGAPARVVIPEMYGYKGVKWLNRITLLDQPFDGYWENRGYDRNAWIDHRA